MAGSLVCPQGLGFQQLWTKIPLGYTKTLFFIHFFFPNFLFVVTYHSNKNSNESSNNNKSFAIINRLARLD